MVISVPRNPEVYTDLAIDDASEDEDVEGDCVEEMLDLHKRSIIETQSIEKHDVRMFFSLFFWFTKVPCYFSVSLVSWYMY